MFLNETLTKKKDELTPAKRFSFMVSEKELLTNVGKVSHKKASEKTKIKYGKYRKAEAIPKPNWFSDFRNCHFEMNVFCD